MNSSARSSCPFCPDITLDPLSHHAVSCRHGGDVVIRHNRLQNIIVDCAVMLTFLYVLKLVEVSWVLMITHGQLMCLLMDGIGLSQLLVMSP